MRNAKEGESLKDAMYSGLDVSDDFKRAYGKDLDKYADKYEGIKKESRDAKISVKDFNDEVVKGGKEAVTNTSIMEDLGAGLKNIGKTALSIGGNILIDTAISYGLTKAGEAWDNYSNKQENAIEKGNEALSNYKQTNSTMQEATSWIKDNAERYTELAKGATSLGEQGTLTDAEFKEYNELSAQMATYLPSQINATTMRAKQKYSIYDSSFNVYQDVIQWFGSSLSIGLTGGDDNGTLTVAGAYFDFLDNNIDCNGNLNIVEDGNLSVAKTTTTGSLSVSNTSTFKGTATFKSTSTFSGTATFTGSLKAGSFTFRDYSEIDDNNIIYRRPVASAGSDKSRVAILQGSSNNKIIIKAQYNSTSFANATFTGSSSDIRLKRDIKDSSVNALSKIMQMQIREFNWKQTGIHQELGCVADELELIDPLLTTGGGYDKDGTMNIKSIDTLLLSEYAIKGIQELYRQNKQQQKRIEYLESQLKNK